MIQQSTITQNLHLAYSEADQLALVIRFLKDKGYSELEIVHIIKGKQNDTKKD